MGKSGEESEIEALLAAHSPQLRHSGVPQHLWPSLLAKLSAEVMDAGGSFSLCEDETRLFPVATRDISVTADEDAVFLVDHAWTFQPHDARKQLVAIPALRQRMLQLLRLEEEGEEEELEAVLEGIWQKAQTYSVRREGASAEELQPLWYVMDEFGSAIPHSDRPNFRTVPFFFAPANAAFSVLFPISDVRQRDEISRDYADSAGACEDNPDWRRLRLHPWIPVDLSDEASDNLPAPERIYSSQREMETLPEEEEAPDSSPLKRPRLSTTFPLKVWAESEQIVKHLSGEFFVRVAEMEEADILWWSTHFKDYAGLRSEWPEKVVNQFASESTLTVKDLLAATLQRSYAPNGPAWLPRTFNLARELPQFVAEFQRRAKEGRDNVWILKPWNLARALDTHVSDNLEQIIRFIDSGPKIAQEYLTKSVLFCRPDSEAWVKMDLRFILLLRSVNPLSLYVFKPFWLRFAIKEFALKEFDDYERHFTVFNYADESKILQMRCEKFIQALEEQNPGLSWQRVEAKIYDMFRQLFTAASNSPPPKGLGANSQSRAMYGVDVMLSRGEESGEVDPKLLEVNFMPDCERACDYYPQFADAVFHTLFSPQPHSHPQSHLIAKIA